MVISCDGGTRGATKTCGWRSIACHNGEQDWMNARWLGTLPLTFCHQSSSDEFNNWRNSFNAFLKYQFTRIEYGWGHYNFTFGILLNDKFQTVVLHSWTDIITIDPFASLAVMWKKAWCNWRQRLDSRDFPPYRGFKSEPCYWSPLIQCHYNLTSAESWAPISAHL